MRIRKRTDYDGWMLEVTVDGQRVRRTFPTREEAELEGARLARQVALAGHRVAMIPADQRGRWLALDDRCRAVGTTLEEAAEAWLRSRPDGGERILAEEVVRRWEADRRPTRSRQHAAAVVNVWREFLQAVGPLGIREVTRGHIAGWLAGRRWQRGRLANLSAVLGWAVRHGLIEVNPADQVPRPEPAMEAEVQVLTPEEAERLMRAIEAATAPDVLAAVTLGLFAGMRQREVSVAAWEDIDLVAGEVVVPLGKTTGRVVAGRRSRKRRVIELEPTAREWLAAAAQSRASGPIRLGNYRKRWEAIRDSVFPTWPANVLRHSYATYHYAIHRDERLLQAQMGHDSRDVLHQHYRAVVRREAAVRFWAIRPC